MLVAITACAVEARDDGAPLKQIQETIVRVRTAPTVNGRADAAQHIAGVAQKMDPLDVDDKTFAELVSLMDSPDDSVRGLVAAAIGFLGTRAKPAIPKLLEVLNKVDCRDGAVTSANSIRQALKRMGVTPPPLPACPERIGG